MALQIAQDPCTLAFRNFVKILQRNGRLAALIKKNRWNVRSGGTCELKAFGVGECPYIILTPEPGPASWSVMGGSTAEHVFDLIIRIETGVEGTNSDDSMNLWGAIREAIFPTSATAEAVEAKALREAASMSRIEIEQPAWGGEPDGDVQMIKGVGRVRIKVHIRTPLS